ncbi:MAG: hypothetical protein HKN13_08285, partial [Rhodothermales bacterium]|nr:hypothetical protein [Rhodothermales bacterium]
MSSRRIFLQQSASSAGALLFASQVFGPSCFVRKRDGSSAGSEIAHGLFFDDADLGRMRGIFDSDIAFASLKQRLDSVDRDDLRRFIESEVRYNDQLFHIVRLSDAAQEMALHFLLTGDRDAAELAADCIRSIMQFDRWDYFLEAGERVVGIQRASSTMIAVAVCSDWLGDHIEDDERTEWLTIMKERGCEACFLSIYGMRYPEEVAGWTRDETSTYFEHRPGDRPTDLSQRHIILDSTNLKAVPASALAIGAIAYREHFGESDDTARWLEQAVFSLNTFGDFFATDGSYHEGVSYANYTALNILKATSVLKRFDVADLTEIINWTGYANFAVGMAMPTASDPFEIVNFGDNGNAKSGEAGKPKRTAVSLWIAANFHDPLAQWFALNLGGEHDEWALIWYDPTVVPQAGSQKPQVWKSDLDWVVARTGFGSDDLTVAMRSGGPGNHEHADRNSIIVKAWGEQLVVDPYRPPYSFTDPRWMMRTTAGHSAVLVDGEGHQYHDGREGTNASDAIAQIVRYVDRKGYCYWTSDATPAYSLGNRDIEQITRTVLVIYDFPAVIIFDKLIKRAEPSRIQARYFGYNHDGSGLIRADGAS